MRGTTRSLQNSLFATGAIVFIGVGVAGATLVRSTALARPGSQSIVVSGRRGVVVVRRCFLVVEIRRRRLDRRRRRWRLGCRRGLGLLFLSFVPLPTL